MKALVLLILVTLLSAVQCAIRRTAHQHIRTRVASPLAACQMMNFYGKHLKHCPPGTIYVSQQDPKAHFKSIQSAIQSLPLDHSSQTILIGAGAYKEVIEVFRSGPTTLLGVTRNPDDRHSNRVRITFSSKVSLGTNEDIKTASVMTISPQQIVGLKGRIETQSLQFSNFGCVDFKAYNIDIINTAGEKDKKGPSAALMVIRSNASFYKSNFHSYQDTLHVGPLARAFFHQCETRGTVDYVFGNGKAVFVDSDFLTRGLGAIVFAWWNQDETPNSRDGVYVNGGRINYAPDAENPQKMKGKGAIARPWNNPHSTVIVKNVKMSDIIRPKGFSTFMPTDPEFDSNTNFAEYNSQGPGGDPKGRSSKLSKILTKEEADRYNLEYVFGGVPSWIDPYIANPNLL